MAYILGIMDKAAKLSGQAFLTFSGETIRLDDRKWLKKPLSWLQPISIRVMGLHLAKGKFQHASYSRLLAALKSCAKVLANFQKGHRMTDTPSVCSGQPKEVSNCQFSSTRLCKKSPVIFVFLLLFSPLLWAQPKSSSKDQKAIAAAAAGLQLRTLGPAFMGGRIADIEVHPRNPSTWYVAVGSGGVWKTINSGTTWQPIFDGQAVYSIGDVAIDPHNPEIIWVGTGENVSGRHVAWGDGVYKSLDGGQSWNHMGLKKSEHIGKILIDPRNSNTIYVAAEGPLWSSGGDRGLYKSMDGGNTWEHLLNINADTGITDLEFHPTNPDILYAAAYQRRRHTWSLLAGGPEAGIYKSTDAGKTWRRLKRGLPSGHMGKIGLAVTAADPSRVYATIEAHRHERGFYRSHDEGETWSKRNSYISGGTGPHYYQELTASQTHANLVYQMDVFMRITRDGGDTFQILGDGRQKHSDNHAFWIDPNNGQHLLAGTDAGLYETFDQGTTWRHFPNMPISQFYKLALDNSEPYFNILGGAQDLGTIFGPSRTTHTDGIRNKDWYVPLGADGYGVDFDPTDNNTLYMMYQNGNLFRYNKRIEELLDIKPQPAPGEAPERFNWDAPLLISPHNPQRIYFGSQRLWRSDNRGDAWQVVSDDLTGNFNRYELDMRGRVWSVDALYDNGAMSKFSTLTSIAESPLQEGLLYTGSDDGFIHVREPGSKWTRAGKLPGVPQLSFINDVEADLFKENTVYAIADAHKIGDFSPYIFKSNDRGKTWKSMAGDLPKGTIIWAIEQDHVHENLFFIGAEFGLYFSVNGGKNWHMLKNGVPPIAFRDIELQRRDNDLVGATFGRGFYVLDDITPLREMAKGALKEGVLPVRDTWWHVPYQPGQAKGQPTMGSDSYRVANPEFGAMISYFVKNLPKTAKEKRKEKESKLKKQGEDIPFPGYETLLAESQESGPKIFVRIQDQEGETVRWLKANAQQGLHRLTWDLRLPNADPINLTPPSFVPPWAGNSVGPLVAPGTYQATLTLVSKDGARQLGKPQSFKVKPMPFADPAVDYAAVAAFQQETRQWLRHISVAGEEVRKLNGLLRRMRAAFVMAPRADASLLAKMDTFGLNLGKVEELLYGDPARGRLLESRSPALSSRIYQIAYGHWGTIQAPTQTHLANLDIVKKDFGAVGQQLSKLINVDLPQIEKALVEAGAPSFR